MEIRNLSDAEFKTLILRMINEFRGRMGELCENFNRVIGNKKMEINNNKKIPARNEE